MLLSIWMAAELCGTDNPPETLWTLPSLSSHLFYGTYVTKFVGEAAFCRTPSTHEKRGLLEPSSRVLGPALLDRAGGRMEELSQQVRFHWSDEKIILPPPLLPLDLMRRQTICEWWHGRIGPKGYEWETSKPAHVSVDVKRICITHSDVMDFPMFALDSSFLLTCGNNESLIRGILSSDPTPPDPPAHEFSF